jgi:hypothetical protein
MHVYVGVSAYVTNWTFKSRQVKPHEKDPKFTFPSPLEVIVEEDFKEAEKPSGEQRWIFA